MRSRVALTEEDASFLAGGLDSQVESAAFASGYLTQSQFGTTIALRDIEWARDEGYEDRTSDRLTLRPQGWSLQLRRRSQEGVVPVFIHTHPGGVARFSSIDDELDRTIEAELRRTAENENYLSLLVSGESGSPAFTGRLVKLGEIRDVDAVRVVGDRLSLHPIDADPLDEPVFDRAVRALGQVGKNTLRSLTIGLAGVGGTGSPTFEQVMRLGVGRILVVDNDVVTDSTISRGYGSSLADIGEPKVSVSAAHAQRVGLPTEVIAIAGDIRDRQSRQALAQCDLIFGCTDSHASRIMLSRLAYLHLVPVIDLGVVVANNNGALDGWGRVTWMAPNHACLLCGGQADPSVAAAEALPTAERQQLAAEGYVAGLDEPAPSVVAYTTMVSAEGVAEFPDRSLKLIPTDGASETLLVLHQRSKRRTASLPRPECLCGSANTWGRGGPDVDLDLLWPT